MATDTTENNNTPSSVVTASTSTPNLFYRGNDAIDRNKFIRNINGNAEAWMQSRGIWGNKDAKEFRAALSNIVNAINSGDYTIDAGGIGHYTGPSIIRNSENTKKDYTGWAHYYVNDILQRQDVWEDTDKKKAEAEAKAKADALPELTKDTFGKEVYKVLFNGSDQFDPTFIDRDTYDEKTGKRLFEKRWFDKDNPDLMGLKRAILTVLDSAGTRFKAGYDINPYKQYFEQTDKNVSTDHELQDNEKFALSNLGIDVNKFAFAGNKYIPEGEEEEEEEKEKTPLQLEVDRYNESINTDTLNNLTTYNNIKQMLENATGEYLYKGKIGRVFTPNEYNKHLYYDNGTQLSGDLYVDKNKTRLKISDHISKWDTQIIDALLDYLKKWLGTKNIYDVNEDGSVKNPYLGGNFDIKGLGYGNNLIYNPFKDLSKEDKLATFLSILYSTEKKKEGTNIINDLKGYNNQNFIQLSNVDQNGRILVTDGRRIMTVPLNYSRTLMNNYLEKLKNYYGINELLAQQQAQLQALLSQQIESHQYGGILDNIATKDDISDYLQQYYGTSSSDTNLDDLSAEINDNNNSLSKGNFGDNFGRILSIRDIDLVNTSIDQRELTDVEKARVLVRNQKLDDIFSDPQDRARIGAALADLASTGMALFGAGSIGAGVVGLGSTGATAYADFTDKGVSSGLAVGNLLTNLAFDAFSFLPVVGAAGKFAKSARLIGRSMRLLTMAASAGYLGFNGDLIINSFNKLINHPSDLTKGDLLTMLNALNIIAGNITGARKRSRGKLYLAQAKITEPVYKVSILGAKGPKQYTIDKSTFDQINNIKKNKPENAAEQIQLLLANDAKIKAINFAPPRVSNWRVSTKTYDGYDFDALRETAKNNKQKRRIDYIEWQAGLEPGNLKRFKFNSFLDRDIKSLTPASEIRARRAAAASRANGASSTSQPAANGASSLPAAPSTPQPAPAALPAPAAAPTGSTPQPTPQPAPSGGTAPSSSNAAAAPTGSTGSTGSGAAPSGASKPSNKPKGKKGKKKRKHKEGGIISREYGGILDRIRKFDGGGDPKPLTINDVTVKEGYDWNNLVGNSDFLQQILSQINIDNYKEYNDMQNTWSGLKKKHGSELGGDLNKDTDVASYQTLFNTKASQINSGVIADALTKQIIVPAGQSGDNSNHNWMDGYFGGITNLRHLGADPKLIDAYNTALKARFDKDNTPEDKRVYAYYNRDTGMVNWGTSEDSTKNLFLNMVLDDAEAQDKKDLEGIKHPLKVGDIEGSKPDKTKETLEEVRKRIKSDITGNDPKVGHFWKDFGKNLSSIAPNAINDMGDLAIVLNANRSNNKANNEFQKLMPSLHQYRGINQQLFRNFSSTERANQLKALLTSYFNNNATASGEQNAANMFTAFNTGDQGVNAINEKDDAWVKERQNQIFQTELANLLKSTEVANYNFDEIRKMAQLKAQFKIDTWRKNTNNWNQWIRDTVDRNREKVDKYNEALESNDAIIAKQEYENAVAPWTKKLNAWSALHPTGDYTTDWEEYDAYKKATNDAIYNYQTALNNSSVAHLGNPLFGKVGSSNSNIFNYKSYS